MKRILKTSLYIGIFIVAGIVFQISCSNTDDVSTTTQTNKIVYFKVVAGEGHFYTCDHDGTGQTQIPFVFPTGINPNPNIISPQLTPDGTKIIFASYSEANEAINIYSCNIDGSGFQEIVTNSPSDGQIGARKCNLNRKNGS